jgi:hypothetical protein
MSFSIEELNKSTSLSVLHGLYRVVMFNDRLTGEEFEDPLFFLFYNFIRTIFKDFESYH